MFFDLISAFEKAKIPYCLVGGYALALQGIVRATVDIDLVVSLQEPHLKEAEEVLKTLGLTSRIPVSAKEIAKFHEEYRTNRNLIAWSFVDFKNPSRQVDLLLYPSLKSVKSERIKVQNVSVNVATKKSLLKMKEAANRPEDQLDIQKLREAVKNENA
jgi:hypothetical protein